MKVKFLVNEAQSEQQEKATLEEEEVKEADENALAL